MEAIGDDTSRRRSSREDDATNGLLPTSISSQTYSTPHPSPPKSESSTSSLSRLSSSVEEEKNTRVEAEKMLMELKELKRTGWTRSLGRQSLSMNAADRTRRERRGLEELALVFQEQEERARAGGNLALATKLKAQRVRTMADSPYAACSNPLEIMATTPMADAAASELAVIAKDYDDVDEGEEAEDQVDLRDGDNDELREVEGDNFALVKELGRIRSLIERARQSIMLAGDETSGEIVQDRFDARRR